MLKLIMKFLTAQSDTSVIYKEKIILVKQLHSQDRDHEKFSFSRTRNIGPSFTLINLFLAHICEINITCSRKLPMSLMPLAEASNPHNPHHHSTYTSSPPTDEFQLCHTRHYAYHAILNTCSEIKW